MRNGTVMCAPVPQARTLTFLRAASFGRREQLMTLLSQGVSPNTADYDKRTALMMACAAGHTVGACWGWGGLAVPPGADQCIVFSRPLRGHMFPPPVSSWNSTSSEISETKTTFTGHTVSVQKKKAGIG